MTPEQNSVGTSGLEENYAHCEAQLKAGDRTAWLASLFAPAERRPALYALGAFVLDVRGVRDKIREPLAGELRLQWWTDAIEGETRGDVRGHPVAAALLDALRRYDMHRAALTTFIDVERDALYDESIPTIAAFDERADQTEGALFMQRAQILAGQVTNPTRLAARHAGRALATVQAIRALGPKRQQMLIPLNLLRAREIGTGDLKLRRASPALTSALAELCAHAAAQITALRGLQTSIDPASAPAFLTASTASLLLRRATNPGFDPFAEQLDLPQWRKQWILWRAASRNGVP